MAKKESALAAVPAPQPEPRLRLHHIFLMPYIDTLNAEGLGCGMLDVKDGLVMSEAEIPEALIHWLRSKGLKI